MCAEKSKEKVVQQAISVGREAINEIKVRCVTEGLNQAEYTAVLVAMAGYICMEVAAETMRKHRDDETNMGLLASRLTLNLISDGAFQGVAAARLDYGPSYPHGSVKVPGTK